MPNPKGLLVVPVGFRTDGTLRAIELDDDDAQFIAFETAAKGLVGGHGWIGAAWQKNPLSFGYSGIHHERVVNNTLSAGQNDLDTTNVPEGEIHVITNYSILYEGTPPTELRACMIIEATTHWIFNELSPTDGQVYSRQGYWVMPPGNKCRFRIVGATLNDTGRIFISGFKIDIDQ